MRSGGIRRSGHRREPVFGGGTGRGRPVRVAVSAARRRAGSGAAGGDCGGSGTRAGSAADGPVSRSGLGSRSSGRHPPIQRPAIAFIRDVATLQSTVLVPAPARTASNAELKSGPRSRIMNLARCACSPRSMSRWRACWAVHVPVGCWVMPRMRMLRAACPITVRTWAWVPSGRSTLKKSQARTASAWERRNCDQVGPVRRGAGSMPLVLRIISHTVDAATLTPRPASSPWILRYPHPGFSRASRRARALMFRELVAQDQDFGGLPRLLTPGQPQPLG